MTNLTVEQLQKWYRKQLRKKSKDFIKLAERSYKVVEHALKDIEEIVEEFEGEDSETGEDGTTLRFANKVKEIVHDFYVEKEITYESTEAMQAEIQRFIQELWAAGRRWIKRMDKKYKALVKSLDSSLKDLMKEMNNIGKLLYKFSWVKDLERIGGRIETLHDLTFSKEVFDDQIRTVRLKIETAEAEYEAALKAYTEFTETSNVAELLGLDEQSEKISSLLRMKLNPLKKQVKKLLQHDTGVRIAPRGQKALVEYFEDPYSAIVEEEDGYPNLLEGLSGLQKAIESGNLPLKDRLARRAVEEIDQIRGGSLLDLQHQAKDIEEKRTRYAGSDVYRKNRELEDALNEAKKNLEYHRNDMLRIRDDITRQIAKVEEFTSRIESEIADAFGEKITVHVEVSLEPLLDLCTVE
ncbi:MAG: hypothetical protein ACTSV3_03580 [Candidatus Thorarchaeota archaeon]|nr:MAG: hypothetical protein DRP09_03590 [Candidatus Thorarchaeota archaeon]RLI59357.1 MAG: hypothetical protein DRO87_03140 [Candidatus Thorarchaeota archaeon]